MSLETLLDKLQNLVDETSHLLHTTYRTYMTPVLQNDSESQEFEIGMYIVYHHHGGILGQSVFTIITFSNYLPNDVWLNVPDIVPNLDKNDGSTSYHLQYNPYTKRLRNRTGNARQYRLIRLI